MKTIAYMNLLLIFLNIGLIFSSKCGANKLKVKLKPVKDTKKIKRMKISESNAKKIYVCNVMTQPGETDGYTVFNHVNANPFGLC